MDPRRASTPSLATLPDDMLTLIVAKVGSHSSVDYYNTIVASKHLNFGSENLFIAKELSLAPLIRKPLLAYKYPTLLSNCLQANNSDAFFVKGMLEYFNCDNRFLGLHYIRLAAKSGHTEGRYIYGVLLMSTGQAVKGKRVINKLTDKEGINAVEDAWCAIKFSLCRVRCTMKDIYMQSFVQMQPVLQCYHDEVNTVCYNCFHFYLMSEFCGLMMSSPPGV